MEPAPDTSGRCDFTWPLVATSCSATWRATSWRGCTPGWGDDDETKLPAATGAIVRAQLKQERRLVTDLTATGTAVLANRSVTQVPLTAHEHPSMANPIGRLRVLAALTSNVSLNAART